MGLIRLPRVSSSEQDAFVLVHVSPDGRQPLDVRIVGTDNENAFAVTLNSAQISKTRHKKSNIDQDQWEKILSIILLGVARSDEDASLMEAVEAVGKVEDTGLTILIRKKIEGITQPLGSISLPANEDEGDNIDLFEWCGTAMKAKDASSDELEVLRTTIGTKDEQVKRLEESLAELTQLKNDNETQLLEKFSLLLNEKKLKIRDQQRLLACSNVDANRLAEVQSSRADVSPRSPGPSRKGKRKADVKDESEDSDGGFEKMEVDEPAADDSEPEQAQTPDDSTADEADSGDEQSDDEPPVASTRKSASSTKGKEASKRIESEQEDEDVVPPPKRNALPPKRDLPLNRKAPAAASKPPPEPESSKPVTQDDGSETESDDEL